MTDPSTLPPPEEVWLLDRSRVELGRRCPRARWLSFHAEAQRDEASGLLVLGGYGRGLRPLGQSLPLATGTHTHSIFASLLSGAEAEEAVSKVVAEYKAQTAPFLEVAPGFDAEGLDVQKETVREQAWLVECLGWVMALRVLPALLETWEVVEVETEHLLLLEGAVGFMARPDAVLRHRVSRRLAVLDLKTASDITGKAFTQQWDTTPQLNSACRAVAEALGEECSSYYVLALHKGRRAPEMDWGKAMGPDRQQSPLCYAYLREMPTKAQEWRPSYYVEVVDEVTGEVRREGSTEKRGWNKVKVWEHAPSARAYVEQLPEAFLSTLVRMIGPVECKDFLIDSYFTGIVAEEQQRWMQCAAEIFERPGDLEVLDRWVPQSWDCWRYGRPCEFRDTCLRVPGALEKFAPRVPHHEPEAARFRAVYGAEGVVEEVDE